jgi:hypothetical protein
MKTPEPVSEAAAEQALRRILRRHERIRDANLNDYLAAAHDPHEMLAVLYRYRHDRGLDLTVRRADQLDGLVRHIRGFWEWTHEDAWLLEWGEAIGANRKQVAQPLRLTTGQGIVDRITAGRRKLAMLRGEPDPAEIARAAPEPAQAARQQRWLNAHTTDLDRVRTVLTARHHLVLASDEAYESLRDITDDSWTPTTITLMGLAAVELSDSPQVRDLPDDHPLQLALSQWADLTIDYRGAGGS